MQDGDILTLDGDVLLNLLDGEELRIVDIIRDAYLLHAQGLTDVPHSLFLTPPGNQGNRFIALPAYLQAEEGVAGVKWIGSFPGNLERGLDRASALIILNAADTGRPVAIVEGSVISAKRTAASAALAARILHADNDASAVGLIGCGVINFEVIRFLNAVLPGISRLTLFDTSQSRAALFGERCAARMPGVSIAVADSIDALLGSASLISMATTASKPHIRSLDACPAGSTILHVSLRDLDPDVMVSSDNVVDDADHVFRAQTSLHLAEASVGHRDFVRCSIGEILTGAFAPRGSHDRHVVFSPFGLGILDLALANAALKWGIQARATGILKSFLPTRAML
ncbi:MAG TPA: 2,3-diaminopropionate biosynthesis protein SbnB [Candidatus Kapabacteria bacterium]|nr:2,3-diaminopropionate biosynthesis protein SbnB [Candidatus Kapabacteria bacterium]